MMYFMTSREVVCIGLNSDVTIQTKTCHIPTCLAIVNIVQTTALFWCLEQGILEITWISGQNIIADDNLKYLTIYYYEFV